MLTDKRLDRRFPYRPLSHTAREIDWLQELVKRCHPTRKAWPSVAWFAYPTHVIQHPFQPRLIAYSSMSIQGAMMQGMGLGVDPDFRGRGLARALLHAKLRVCRQVGTVTTYAGMTQADNAPMIRLFEQVGLTQSGVVEGYFNDLSDGPKDGVVFVGDETCWAET